MIGRFKIQDSDSDPHPHVDSRFNLFEKVSAE